MVNSLSTNPDCCSKVVWVKVKQRSLNALALPAVFTAVIKRVYNKEQYYCASTV